PFGSATLSGGGYSSGATIRIPVPCGNPVVAPPETGPVMPEKLWCVAKSSMPPEKLQEALDFACGAGRADCEEIQPMGSCYYPDTAVAHASFAFNSYWQKNKRFGGTCSFGGTAMIINADPILPKAHLYNRKARGPPRPTIFEETFSCKGGDVAKNQSLVETIVWLLPSEKGSVSCSFMLRLLEAVIILVCGYTLLQ
ncbi:Glucan endo-1,3-beta-glucosidase 1-like protein, partial [Drosera capensis]